jgi:hypothetical protein
MKTDRKTRSKILRSKREPRAGRDARITIAQASPPRRFKLCGERALTHRHAYALTESADDGTPAALAWGAHERGALVLVRAEVFAQLVGRAVHSTTFAPSRFCSVCGRFVGPQPARCMRCNPPTAKARTVRR